ncbi:protein-disulfide reductase DsbD domain-containing protein [Ancylobacter sp. G4_0304]|uniref:protein-disulfide reductase DsbD domain-containing protein n=1 Tax=Ancylobacter sp. G4_0304 TaxID=3114289 RepID=UPI0039C61357
MLRLCRHLLTLLAVAGALAVFDAGAARAGIESSWSAPAGTAVRLIGGAREDGRLSGGIEIRLTPGWKTYWRYPGDAGIPPRFDWSGSHNVGNLEIFWPAPVRFDEGGSVSIGYKHGVVIPFAVTPQDPSKPVALRLALDFAVCEKICQPANAIVTLDLPAEGAAPSPPALLAAQATVPRPAGLGAPGDTGIDAVTLETINGTPTIRVIARVAETERADLFVEGPTEDWALPLPHREAGADGRTQFLLPVDGVPTGADVSATKLKFTLVDGTRAAEITTPLSIH